jgi:hypothetical protein
MATPKTPGTSGAAPLPPPGPAEAGAGPGGLQAFGPGGTTCTAAGAAMSIPEASVGAAPRAPVALPQGPSTP